jgi:ABC-2 type transport system ATP-binding protein
MSPATIMTGNEPTAESLVWTDRLAKRYGSFVALEDCSLHVTRGEVFGLLGPNGAGKTTLLRLLLGFLRPSSGRAFVAGLDCQRQSLEVRRQVAYLPGDARLFPRMRGRDVLQFFAQLRGDGQVSRSVELASRLNLDTRRRVAFMSTGMRQKLALVVALATRAQLLVLDEPTSNLDPNVRGEVTALVSEAQAAGRTVLFSSHILSEVEEVCDRVAIVRAGRIVHTQCINQLRRQHRIQMHLTAPLPPVPAGLQDQVTVVQHDHRGFATIDTVGDLSPLLAWLSNLPVDEMTITAIGLRVVYDKFHPPASPGNPRPTGISA